MRAHFVDDWPAARVADQFGYSTASVHQMATLVRTGRMRLFTDAKPGPKGPTKATGALRDKVLRLRAGKLSVTEIAQILTREGTPVSAQTVWKICDAQGLRGCAATTPPPRGPASRLAPLKAAARDGWPAEPTDLPCDHAGLLLLAPAMVELGLPELIGQAGYPRTRALSAWHSLGTLLLAAATRGCSRPPHRPHHRRCRAGVLPRADRATPQSRAGSSVSVASNLPWWVPADTTGSATSRFRFER